MAITGKVPRQFSSDRSMQGERFNVKPGLYYVQLMEVDEAEPYPGRNPDWGNSWQWKFLVSDQSGRLITAQTMGSDGLPQALPMIQYTSDRMGVSPAGVKAKGRQWLEALLRRDLEEDADLADVTREATGEIAQALISLATSKSGTPYCTIAQMIPADDEIVERFRAKQQGQTTATAVDENDDVPF